MKFEENEKLFSDLKKTKQEECQPMGKNSHTDYWLRKNATKKSP